MVRILGIRSNARMTAGCRGPLLTVFRAFDKASSAQNGVTSLTFAKTANTRTDL